MNWFNVDLDDGIVYGSDMFVIIKISRISYVE